MEVKYEICVGNIHGNVGSIMLPFCPYKGTILYLKYKGHYRVHEIIIEENEDCIRYKLITERHIF
jgi:hypothetical protein